MTRWLCLLLLSVLVVQVAYSHPRVRRQIELQDSENLTPVDDEVAGDDADRDKRNLEGATQAKYGAKNAILGFVFGSSTPTQSQSKTTRRPRTTITTTTDNIPVFDRNKVSLQFPGELFGPSVSLLIKSTKVIGSVIQNSAERYRTFLGLFKPFFRGVFEIKGLDPVTTPKPIRMKSSTKASKENSINNEIRR
ncbi:uncharacterized protein LOC143915675 isoform X2 [Arctopsyche grandis]|uniref:uncharacterized protein LOC143915675 isoform X2 n=1 Tax=Arctopsyche grandis TaxID=121162 RepID=UPI00406D86CB